MAGQSETRHQLLQQIDQPKVAFQSDTNVSQNMNPLSGDYKQFQHNLPPQQTSVQENSLPLSWPATDRNHSNSAAMLSTAKSNDFPSETMIDHGSNTPKPMTSSFQNQECHPKTQYNEHSAPPNTTIDAVKQEPGVSSSNENNHRPTSTMSVDGLNSKVTATSDDSRIMQTEIKSEDHSQSGLLMPVNAVENDHLKWPNSNFPWSAATQNTNGHHPTFANSNHFPQPTVTREMSAFNAPNLSTYMTSNPSNSWTTGTAQTNTNNPAMWPWSVETAEMKEYKPQILPESLNGHPMDSKENNRPNALGLRKPNGHTNAGRVMKATVKNNVTKNLQTVKQSTNILTSEQVAVVPKGAIQRRQPNKNNPSVLRDITNSNAHLQQNVRGGNA